MVFWFLLQFLAVRYYTKRTCGHGSIWDYNPKAVTTCLQGSCHLHGSFGSRPKRELEGVCGF